MKTLATLIMNRINLLLIGVLSGLCTFAQPHETVTEINITSTPVKSYIVNKLGKISAGVTISGSSGPFFLRANGSIPAVLNQGQSFVSTETVLMPQVTTSAGVTALSDAQKRTTLSYIDGMGREIENINVKASPSGRDVITAKSYDNMGNKNREYLPYTSQTNNGFFHSGFDGESKSFYSGTANVAYEPARPFSEHVYENSSIRRLNETYGPGSEWLSASKRNQFKVKVENADVVKKWTYTDDITPPSYSTYGQHQLLLNETVDEEDHIVREYYNDRNQIVLRQAQQTGSAADNPGVYTWLDTYYVYDILGRLRIILPPAASDALTEYTNANDDGKRDFLNKWAYQFAYDGFGRAIKKKMPCSEEDGDCWVYNVYDKWDRLVLSQDAIQRSVNQWIFTKYDRFNRVALTGIYTTSTSHDNLQTDAMNAVSRYETTAPNAIGYTYTTTFPSGVSIADIHTITYYDNYDFLANGWGDEHNVSAYAFVNESGFPQSGDKLSVVKGQITGMKIRVLEKDTWLNTVNYFDRKYHAIQIFSENYMGGIDRITSSFDFIGNILKIKTVHNSSSGSLTTLEENLYDTQGRMLKTYHTTGSGGTVLLAQYNYNELGQLTEKNLHSADNGSTFLQSVDQQFNIRGWITAINNSSLVATGSNSNDQQPDLFGMDILYNQEEIAINGENTRKSYNGNISGIRWKSNNQKDAPKEKIFGFRYDDFNRLKQARYATKDGSVFNTEQNAFNETVAYDKNGNITSLQRQSVLGGLVKEIDNLQYYYEGKGNQLQFLEDNSSYWATSDNNPDYGYAEKTQYKKQGLTIPEYVYDANGRLKVDYNKGITNIRYNYLNLPVEITINGKVIEYVYDATSVRHQKLIKPGTGSVTPEYTENYVGNVQYYNNQLQFALTDEGRIVKNGANYDYEYFIKDHQGNTRITFGHMNETKVSKATMEIERDAKESSPSGEGFKNITRAPGYNLTKKSAETPVPQYAAALTGSVGPAKMLSVSEGDKVNVEAFARYTGTVGSSKILPAALATAVTGAFSISQVESPAAYNGINSGVLGHPVGAQSSAPAAYLLYFIFTTDYALIQWGAHSVSTDAVAGFEKLFHNLTIDFPTGGPQQGFVYMYVANETTSTTVYFDEIQVIHEKVAKSLQVTQAMDYYPFGLSISPLSYQKPKAGVDHASNNYFFQNQELQDDLGLGWYQFKYRMHDPATGRFTSIDPLAVKYAYNSPYAFSENKLISYVELEGLESVMNVVQGSPKEGYVPAEIPGASSQLVDDGTPEAQMTINEAKKSFPDEVQNVKTGILTVFLDNEGNYQGFHQDNTEVEVNVDRYTWEDVDSYKGMLTLWGQNLEGSLGKKVDEFSNNVKRMELGVEGWVGTSAMNVGGGFGTYSTSANNVGLFAKYTGQFDMNNISILDPFKLSWDLKVYIGLRTTDSQLMSNGTKTSLNLGRINLQSDSRGEYKLGYNLASPKFDVRYGQNPKLSFKLWESKTVTLGN
jgi:RHS repeat-associated protein